MKIVQREHIDTQLWDEKISQSTVENPTIYAEVLDICSDHWCAIVNEDYSFLLPLTYTKKMGVKRLSQASFARQVDFIGSEKLMEKAIEIIKKEFKIADIGLTSTPIFETTKKFQRISLNEEIIYSNNAKRILKKKKDHFVVEKINNNDSFVEIYQNNSFKKFQQAKENPVRLKKFIEYLQKNGRGEVVGIKKNQELIAGISLIYDKKTCYYLIGDATVEAKKEGLMFILMDFAIHLSKEKGFDFFDFGGSNVPSVANFYHKFGGKDHFYTHLSWNQSPLWYRILKRLK